MQRCQAWGPRHIAESNAHLAELMEEHLALTKVFGEIRESMNEAEVEIILQRAR